MKRKEIKLIKSIVDLVIFLTPVLIIFLGLSNTGLAGDSISFTVTCTIPAIPGVNAPMIEQETIRTDTSATVQEDTNMQNNLNEQPPAMIQEKKEQEMPLMQGQTVPIIVKTLYSR